MKSWPFNFTWFQLKHNYVTQPDQITTCFLYHVTHRGILFQGCDWSFWAGGDQAVGFRKHVSNTREALFLWCRGHKSKLWMCYQNPFPSHSRRFFPPSYTTYHHVTYTFSCPWQPPGVQEVKLKAETLKHFVDWGIRCTAVCLVVLCQDIGLVMLLFCSSLLLT